MARKQQTRRPARGRSAHDVGRMNPPNPATYRPRSIPDRTTTAAKAMKAMIQSLIPGDRVRLRGRPRPAGEFVTIRPDYSLATVVSQDGNSLTLRYSSGHGPDGKPFLVQARVAAIDIATLQRMGA